LLATERDLIVVVAAGDGRAGDQEQQAEPRSKRPRRMRPKGWTPELVEAVEALRLDHPMWGRGKIGPLLRREGFTVSDATVGRIIAHLVKRRPSNPCPFCAAAKAGPRGHGGASTQPLPKGHKPQAPGQLVQIDTLSVNVRPDRAVKQITAYDPVARYTAAEAFSRATATWAATFLNKLIAAMPFPVTAIQSLPPRRSL
jgi:hypothetical protein